MNRPRHALAPDRTDLRERDPDLSRGVRDRLADQDLAGARVVGHARAEVDGLTEVVARLEQDGPRMQTDVRGRQPGGEEVERERAALDRRGNTGQRQATLLG